MSHTNVSLEDEARDRAKEELIGGIKENGLVTFLRATQLVKKDFEEFFTVNEVVDMERFETVGVIKNRPNFDEARLDGFIKGNRRSLRKTNSWTKSDIVNLYPENFAGVCPQRNWKILRSEDVELVRFFDILLSATALLLLSPLLVPIIIILKLTGEGEVSLLQERIGKDGEEFNLFKFATMLKESPNIGTRTVTMKDDPRGLASWRSFTQNKN